MDLKDKILSEMVESDEEYQRNKTTPRTKKVVRKYDYRIPKYQEKINLILDAVKEGRTSEVSGFDDVPKFNLYTFRLLLYKVAKTSGIKINIKERLEREYNLRILIIKPM